MNIEAIQSGLWYLFYIWSITTFIVWLDKKGSNEKEM